MTDLFGTEGRPPRDCSARGASTLAVRAWI
jgi:hypothetical protein